MKEFQRVDKAVIAARAFANGGTWRWYLSVLDCMLEMEFA